MSLIVIDLIMLGHQPGWEWKAADGQDHQPQVPHRGLQEGHPTGQTTLLLLSHIEAFNGLKNGGFKCPPRAAPPPFI